MHCALVGLGLINGSVALALRAAGGWTTTAWSVSGTGPAAALAAGAIDATASSLEAALADADLVVLGAPPTACLALLDAIGSITGALAPDAVVTDVASTKRLIMERAAARGLRFVGGHPMAGRESSGFAAATADLFRERPWVIVPGQADEAAVARVRALAVAVGARPLVMDEERHDRAVAAISHLPLLSSVALVEAIAGGPGGAPADGWAFAAPLAAGGWRDTTRLARGDPAMGAGIAATNAAEIAAALRRYRGRLDEWIAALDVPGGPDEAALARRLESARARLGDAG